MKKIYTSVICATLLLASNVNALDINEAAKVASSVVSTNGNKSMDLVGMLTSQLGVSDKQAKGGLGSILNYAKGALSSGEYSTLANAIPGAESLVKSASSALSNGNTAGSLSSLASSFSSLGLNSDMVGKFVPVIMDYFKGSGNLDAIGILTKLFA